MKMNAHPPHHPSHYSERFHQEKLEFEVQNRRTIGKNAFLSLSAIIFSPLSLCKSRPCDDRLPVMLFLFHHAPVITSDSPLRQCNFTQHEQFLWFDRARLFRARSLLY